MLSLLAAPYTLLFVIGATITASLAWRHGARNGWSVEVRAAVIAAVLVGGTIGSRWFPVEGHMPVYGDKTVVGALLGAGLALLLVARVTGLGARVFDAAIPAVPIGMAVGRIGCFLAGCCFGTPTTLAWGVRYASASMPFNEMVRGGQLALNAVETMPLHPVQLYEAAADLAIVLLVMRLGPRFRSPGSAPLAFGMLYAIARFALEFVRFEGAPVAGLKPVQWGMLGAAMALGSVLAWRCQERAVGPAAGSAARGLNAAPFAVGAIVIAIGSLGWATPLEAGLLLTATALLVVAYAPIGAAGEVRLVPLGAILLLQGGGGAPVDTYPKSWFTFGGGASVAQFQTVDETCSGDRYTRVNDAVLYGVDVGLRRQRSRDDGIGLSASVFGGSNRASAATHSGGTSGATGQTYDPAAGTINVAGAAIWTDLDSKWVGATIGVAGGTLAMNNGSVVKKESSAFSGGLRFGKLTGFFVDLKSPPPVSGFAPIDFARFALGFAIDSGRSILRIGLADSGPFAALHGVLDGKWEVDPSFAAGGIIRLAVRRRFAARKP